MEADSTGLAGGLGVYYDVKLTSENLCHDTHCAGSIIRWKLLAHMHKACKYKKMKGLICWDSTRNLRKAGVGHTWAACGSAADHLCDVGKLFILPERSPSSVTCSYPLGRQKIRRGDTRQCSAKPQRCCLPVHSRHYYCRLA